MTAVPDGYEDLLTRPLYGDLATVRPDGDPSVTPMWFAWDGELLRFTHTSKRQKTRDIEHNPRIAFVITDPGPAHALPAGARPPSRASRLTRPARSTSSCRSDTATRIRRPPPDAPDRVVITVRPFAFTKRG